MCKLQVNFNMNSVYSDAVSDKYGFTNSISLNTVSIRFQYGFSTVLVRFQYGFSTVSVRFHELDAHRKRYGF